MTIPTFRADDNIWLDYVHAADDPQLLRNLSAIAMAGRFLWTASDEGRTIECLEPTQDGFQLRQQVSLADFFADLPGEKKGDEVDVESLDVADGVLWVCGSHCRVRRKPDDDGKINPGFRNRASRSLLGSAALNRSGAAIEGPGIALPFKGPGSLREVLRQDAYVAPFHGLPSKENGLDIEGICVSGARIFVGLRGPLVDSIGIVFELPVAEGTAVITSALTTHFLDLGGLGVRDLARNGRDIIVLAGPVSSAPGPFRLYRWKPQQTERVQSPEALRQWPQSTEQPEGICRFDHDGSRGFLVVYDAPDDRRIRKSRYRADWVAETIVR